MPDDALSASVAGRVDLEEERRLFYVGMTRAQQKLFLTRAQRRTFFGQRISNAPSPFLADIEDALKEINQGEQRTGAKVVAEQLSLF
jgi:DNA helicase-2/ATP-dependent DNA helicase PcrA